MVEQIKMDVDRLPLVQKLKESSILTKYFGKFIFMPKVVYLRPLTSSLPFLKFKKQNCMYF